MKIIKLSNKNFKLFKEFCEEWIDERNELIDPVNENYLLRNFDLPFGTTGTVLDGNKDNITIGPGDDEEIIEAYK